MRGFANLTVLALVLAACGGTTAEVVIDSNVQTLENGTFNASGDLFACDGEFTNLELHLNEGNTWWFEDEFTCSDGSGALVIRTEGDGAEPDVGESVGTWKVISGRGDYDGFTGSGSYDFTRVPWAERRQGELTSG